MSELKLLHPHPALLLTTSKKHLIIGDLHIAFEEKYASKGIKIRPSITDMQQTLQPLIEKYQPEEVVLLGDLKASVNFVTKSEARLIPEFLHTITSMTNVSIIPGNHDHGINHLIPSTITIHDSFGIMMEDTLLLHGHTTMHPRFKSANRVIMGHVHPRFKEPGSPLDGAPVWLIIRTEKKVVCEEAAEGSMDIVVMPSFNQALFSMGKMLLPEDSIAPILRRAGNAVLDAKLVTLGGELVGDVNQFEEIFATLKSR
jgi:putative SbcD/Mre11-related phosphoesterase